MNLLGLLILALALGRAAHPKSRHQRHLRFSRRNQVQDLRIDGHQQSLLLVVVQVKFQTLVLLYHAEH
ncbi:hypothetical protein AN213_03199 [Pseudoalteromonas sp. P1-8]|nr:hypothetical protein AN213_03199 [Pseudoalteromonas sp. P1-8]